MPSTLIKKLIVVVVVVMIIITTIHIVNIVSIADQCCSTEIRASLKPTVS